MIPVILFVYNRPEHLARVLACLKENQVPKLYIYSDGAKTSDQEPKVTEVRNSIRGIDWCETVIIERDVNWGLGKSILAGVSEIFEKEDMVLVVEDDLICVPGTYQYLCAALEQYKDNPNVMSVTGWTHRLVTPVNVYTFPYFDGRAECWIWGTWKRAWDGILNHNARLLIEVCERNGIDPIKYGYDLPEMAEIEEKKNIWAVRFLYWHIVNKGLCMRPPWSMVDHIGDDSCGTNIKGDLWTKCANLYPAPPIPKDWPVPVENRQCAELHRNASMCNLGVIRKIRRWYTYGSFR